MECPYCLSVLHEFDFSCQASLLKLGLNLQSFVFSAGLENALLALVMNRQLCSLSFMSR